MKEVEMIGTKDNESVTQTWEMPVTQSDRVIRDYVLGYCAENQIEWQSINITTQDHDGTVTLEGTESATAPGGIDVDVPDAK